MKITVTCRGGAIDGDLPLAKNRGNGSHSLNLPLVLETPQRFLRRTYKGPAAAAGPSAQRAGGGVMEEEDDDWVASSDDDASDDEVKDR